MSHSARRRRWCLWPQYVADANGTGAPFDSRALPNLCVSLGLRLTIPRCEQQRLFLAIVFDSMPNGPAPKAPSIRRRLQTMLRISDTVRRTQTQDGGVLLDIHHGQMFSLNIVGAKILELIERGYDEPRIAEEISRTYAADSETVRAHVVEFLESLHKHHILLPVVPADVP